MLKNIQTKIVMVFVIFGIIVTTAISTLSIYHIKKWEAFNSTISEEGANQIIVEAKKAEK